MEDGRWKKLPAVALRALARQGNAERGNYDLPASRGFWRGKLTF